MLFAGGSLGLGAGLDSAAAADRPTARVTLKIITRTRPRPQMLPMPMLLLATLQSIRAEVREIPPSGQLRIYSIALPLASDRCGGPKASPPPTSTITKASAGGIAMPISIIPLAGEVPMEQSAPPADRLLAGNPRQKIWNFFSDASG